MCARASLIPETMPTTYPPTSCTANAHNVGRDVLYDEPGMAFSNARVVVAGVEAVSHEMLGGAAFALTREADPIDAVREAQGLPQFSRLGLRRVLCLFAYPLRTCRSVLRGYANLSQAIHPRLLLVAVSASELAQPSGFMRRG